MRVAATAASRPRKRAARVAVGLVATLGILFLGVLGSLVRQDAAKRDPEAASSTTSITTAPAAQPAAPPEPPPCPAADGSSPRRTRFDMAPERCIDPAKSYRARFVTSAGVFFADLDQQRSPLAVNNFVFLARYHFYDGLTFNRVVSGFYAQAGQISQDQPGPGYTFDDDPLPAKGEYQVGSLVLAHTRADDNGSQFLIWLGPQVKDLDPVFPLFGQVTQGLDVIAEIGAGGSTNGSDPKPTVPYEIDRVEIIEGP